MKNQRGSLFIWIIILGLLLLILIVCANWYFRYYSKSQLTEQLTIAQPIPVDSPHTDFIKQPSPSPDFSAAQEQYNLDSQQIKILSNVVDDEKL